MALLIVSMKTYKEMSPGGGILVCNILPTFVLQRLYALLSALVLWFWKMTHSVNRRKETECAIVAFVYIFILF